MQQLERSKNIYVINKIDSMFYVKCKSIQQVILVNSTPGPHDPREETDIQDPFSVST
jgi:hypothetical protein